MKLLRRAMTLLELLIALTLVSIIAFSLVSIQVFSRYQLLASDRRVKLQNELSYALEHMTKNIQLSIGDAGHPAMTAVIGTFSVRRDLNNPPTLNDFSDDIFANYALANNSLFVLFNGINETLSNHIITGTSLSPMPVDPTSGFYINLTDNSTCADIGLVGRWQPTQPMSSADNPQVVMRTKACSGGASTR